MGHDIFICYATGDRRNADRVVDELEGAGIGCWIAPRDVPSERGDPGILAAAIRGSRLLILILSSRCDQSRRVMSEIELAARNCIPILPVRAEKVDPSWSMERFVARGHWIDATKGSSAEWPKRLMVMVRLLLDWHEADEHEMDAKPAEQPSTGSS